MSDCRFKPIEKWPSKPTPAYARQYSRFKAGWPQALDLLERELSHLSAKEINIEGFFAPKDVRNDGWPKSSARPTQPGVILSFNTKLGRMIMPCDRFTDWEANLRAIALTLEHLRAVERYGVTTKRQEQYTGWLRLPATSQTDELTELARKLIDLACVGCAPSDLPRDKSLFEKVVVESLRRNHSDTATDGGSATGLQDALQARNRIRELKGW